MMALLQREGLIHVFDGKYPDGTSNSDKEKIEGDALSVIQLSLASNVLCEVSTITEETAKQLWDKLQGLYQDRSLTTRMLLQRQYRDFENSMMYSKEPITLEQVRQALNSCDVRRHFQGDKDDEASGLFESLCVAHNDGDTTIDIWIIKGYGDPESWAKQFSISRSITFSVVADEFFSIPYGGSVPHEHHVTYYLFQPMASRKNGEILWRACYPYLVSYDLAVKKMKFVCIHSTTFERFHGALYVNTYKESLVLLDKRTDIYTCDEESFYSCKKEELKGGGKKFLKGKTKRRFQNVSSFRGLMCMSKIKGKRLRKIKQKKNKQVQ
ncbi:hypothetical protein HAX54_014622 [Datura stramonium]|uniref:Uncharacterized protein n=1 Tax=Datura stramonium TaxID=4076 RepID=A0ABS8TQ70_DATST|nr:hypothetical protein [Datura stramonium]